MTSSATFGIVKIATEILCMLSCRNITADPFTLTVNEAFWIHEGVPVMHVLLHRLNSHRSSNTSLYN